ncbi:MAG: LacI family DNA-binding transcriptional regulator, partial [Victivallales bacterium]|nr:LacI family transcriptional regulator [bacterium]MDY5696108.1 LacI family DNA-binding transcriptional regulator [Victivallales bacterium]
MRNRITIQEFAEKTGVSIATISRAFTGNGRISPETRKRILEAAGKYGYSAGTRKLKSECDIPEIVFFYPELYSGEPDYFTAEIIVNIKRHLGNDHIFTVTPFDENDDHIIDSAKVRMLNGSVAGIIVVAGSPGAEKLAQTADSCSVPYVLIGRIPGFEYNTVLHDNEYGAFLAGKYFRETGRR